MNRIFTIFLLSLLVSTTYAQIDQGKILDYVNDLRATGCECGKTLTRTVSQVFWDKDLAVVAQDYADELAELNDQIGSKGENGFISHISKDGKNLEDRLKEHNVPLKWCVENLAYMRGNENLAMDYWLNNPETCNNIMNKNAVIMGVGRSGKVWVMLLGKK